MELQIRVWIVWIMLGLRVEYWSYHQSESDFLSCRLNCSHAPKKSTSYTSEHPCTEQDWSVHCWRHFFRPASHDFECCLSNRCLLCVERMSGLCSVVLHVQILEKSIIITPNSLSLYVLTAILQVNLGQPVPIEAKDDGGSGDNMI